MPTTPAKTITPAPNSRRKKHAAILGTGAGIAAIGSGLATIWPMTRSALAVAAPKPVTSPLLERRFAPSVLPRQAKEMRTTRNRQQRELEKHTMRKATNHKITRAPKPAVTPTGSAPTTTTHPASKPKLLSRPRSKATPKPIPTPLVGPPVIAPVPVAEIPPPAGVAPPAPTPPLPSVEAPASTAPPVAATQTPPPDTGFSVSEWALDGRKPSESPTPPLVEVGPTVPAILTVPPAVEAPAIVEWALNGTAPPTQPGMTLPDAGAAPTIPTPAPENAEPEPVVESNPEPTPTESEATGLPLSTDPPSAPTVPVFSIPPTHTVEDVSSIQIGDVLIIAIKVMRN